jgi:hypothetical protein
MAKYLRFRPLGKVEMIVLGKNDYQLGSIVPHGEIFKRQRVFSEGFSDIEWTSKCLRQLADFMDSQDVAAKKQGLSVKKLKKLAETIRRT